MVVPKRLTLSYFFPSSPSSSISPGHQAAFRAACLHIRLARKQGAENLLQLFNSILTDFSSRFTRHISGGLFSVRFSPGEIRFAITLVNFTG
jgi:hypothetical protein